MPERFRTGTNRVMPVLIALAVLLSGCGQPAETTIRVPAQPTGSADGAGPSAEVVQALRAAAVGDSQGEVLYEFHCAICHGALGTGGVGPPLADNPNMQVDDYVVAQVLLGGGGMPPFAPRLSDSEIAAVLSFVRTSWGNRAGPIATRQVGVQRSGLRPGMRLGPSADGIEEVDGPDGISAGEMVYVQQGCSGCHGVDGGGGIGPALAGNGRLAHENSVIEQILHGGGGMPPFAAQLSDEEIAAVASYERSAWGNDLGAIEPEEVAARRPAEDGP